MIWLALLGFIGYAGFMLYGILSGSTRGDWVIGAFSSVTLMVMAEIMLSAGK
jgi:hypothetical protein